MKAWALGVGIAGVLVGLPAIAQEHFTGDLCGNKVDVTLKAPSTDANPGLKQFWGVWGSLLR